MAAVSVHELAGLIYSSNKQVVFVKSFWPLTEPTVGFLLAKSKKVASIPRT